MAVVGHQYQGSQGYSVFQNEDIDDIKSKHEVPRNPDLHYAQGQYRSYIVIIHLSVEPWLK